MEIKHDHWFFCHPHPRRGAVGRHPCFCRRRPVPDRCPEEKSRHRHRGRRHAVRQLGADLYGAGDPAARQRACGRRGRRRAGHPVACAGGRYGQARRPARHPVDAGSGRSAECADAGAAESATGSQQCRARRKTVRRRPDRGIAPARRPLRSPVGACQSGRGTDRTVHDGHGQGDGQFDHADRADRRCGDGECRRTGSARGCRHGAGESGGPVGSGAGDPAVDRAGAPGRRRPDRQRGGQPCRRAHHRAAAAAQCRAERAGARQPV